VLGVVGVVGAAGVAGCVVDAGGVVGVVEGCVLDAGGVVGVVVGCALGAGGVVGLFGVGCAGCAGGFLSLSLAFTGGVGVVACASTSPLNGAAAAPKYPAPPATETIVLPSRRDRAIRMFGFRLTAVGG
jgi:hypothetical protein